jgi:gluconokinase
MILILMGVSGIGKTTIGKLLSTRTGWKFAGADDAFPELKGAPTPSGKITLAPASIIFLAMPEAHSASWQR